MVNEQCQFKKKELAAIWITDFMMQLMTSFDLRIKDLKRVEYKSEEEVQFYKGAVGTHHDLYFLYFVDYIQFLVQASGSNGIPTKISQYPLYFGYAFDIGIEYLRSLKAYPNILHVVEWIEKIMEANLKYLESTKTADLLTAKYSRTISKILYEHREEFHNFSNAFNSSKDFAIKAILGVNGSESMVQHIMDDHALISFVPEINILIERNGRFMIPLMMRAQENHIHYITPSLVGAIVSYTKTMQSSQKRHYIDINNAQVVASLFQNYRQSVEKDILNKIIFKKMELLSAESYVKLQEGVDVAQKIHMITAVVMLDEYQKHFAYLAPIITNELRECFTSYMQKSASIQAEMLYDFSLIIQKHIGTLTLYKENRTYRNDLKQYLHKEIRALIYNVLKNRGGSDG